MQLIVNHIYDIQHCSMLYFTVKSLEHKSWDVYAIIVLVILETKPQVLNMSIRNESAGLSRHCRCLQNICHVL